MFREFEKQDTNLLKKNYLKNIKKFRLKVMREYEDLSWSEIEFLMWGYDLKFFTIDYAANDLGMFKRKVGELIIYPLVKRGWMYKHFDKLSPSQKREDHLFREETKMNYRVRYALTEKARLAVQRAYLDLESL